MSDRKRTRFGAAASGARPRWQQRVFVQEPPFPAPDVIPTGVAAFDALLGIGGVPLGALTHLSGRSAAGRLALGSLILARAQRTRRTASRVALLDARGRCDLNYLADCGVALNQLLVVLPAAPSAALAHLPELLALHRPRAVLLDGLDEEWRAPEAGAPLAYSLQLAQQIPCALLVLSEQPRWPHWSRRAAAALYTLAAVHVELQHERWRERADKSRVYEARARVRKNLWGRSSVSSPLAIMFEWRAA